MLVPQDVWVWSSRTAYVAGNSHACTHVDISVGTHVDTSVGTHVDTSVGTHVDANVGTSVNAHIRGTLAHVSTHVNTYTQIRQQP